ncbi:heavy-metal-associated domain-containing protein [Sphingomonas sp. AOB5]|uniref:heavy-metal-associated domain-containing protein n=1 Tax=Sphingomonas sp. AOB5 TaxID=3034017 RepID=UPI0023F8B17E|nr:heavy-metal-associated domain-containing protein [Sphingomonas sp. AOB5]MDF7777174.1 heavy-metal-associated domain-containing protein [Sphingomonas sp. AOB5]
MIRRRSPFIYGFAAAVLIAGAAGGVMAQRGKAGANTASSDPASFEVSGVEVDVRGADADAARTDGWRVAQRKGWDLLARRLTGRSSSLSDSALDALVTGIVVEHEQIGPNRYIAKLGVLFDRSKAGAILGVNSTVSRSTPMLLVPVEWTGGTGRVFERPTAWAAAWTRFRSSNSTIDYVRPRGGAGDALLINAGQIGRRGRGWWRAIVDQYGATDVLIAEVQLRPDYPGGPVTAIFTASHGPDRVRITQFALRVDNAAGLDSMLDKGIERIDRAYQAALASGALKTDHLLAYRPPEEKPVEEEETPEDSASPSATPGVTDTTASFTVQVETPTAASVNAAESGVRGVPGVRSASTTSLALGGVSVMSVRYDGPIGSLRAALEGRGWQVQEGPGVLRIRRPGGGGSPNPQPSDSPKSE